MGHLNGEVQLAVGKIGRSLGKRSEPRKEIGPEIEILESLV